MRERPPHAHTPESAIRLCIDGLEDLTTGRSLPMWKAREMLNACYSTVPDGPNYPNGNLPERIS